MVKCSKAEVRRLRTALRWKLPSTQRERIQMVLLREGGMTQPAIAAAMGVSLSTVNRAHMAYDDGGIKALKPKANGGRKRENMTVAEEKALLARFAHAAGARSLIVSHWNVSDEATARLMIGTFRASARNEKLSHAEALRQSMLAMIDGASSDAEADPRLWAPFVVVGEPAK